MVRTLFLAMPANTPDTLAPNSLDWARAHITKFGDTDVFPVPFEFESLWSNWVTARDALAAQDLSSVPNRGSRTILVPKPRGGFRVATQLDPLDSLTYAAMGYEAAPKIEASRVPSNRRIACSYRLAPTAAGELFVSNADGWTDFQGQSRTLAGHRACTHVAIADISDFYNQIYHHRLHNSLETALVPEPRPKNLEAFLGRVTAKQSRGIPVGPAASILFAESCLNDVDQYLVNHGFVHTRYVDDFRVFCKGEAEATRALHDLTRYLFTAHRLSLQAHKTRIMEAKDFIKRELVEPEERESKSKIAQAKKVIQEAIAAAGHYGDTEIDEEEILEENEQKIARKALLATFKSCVERAPIHLGLARYLLRRAASLRLRVLVRPAVENMPALTPVFRELVQYLDRVWHAEVQDIVSNALPGFLKDDPQGWLPYIQDWSLWLVTKRDVLTPSKALALADKTDPTLRVRHRALLAMKLKQVDWIREQKEVWMNFGPWERRAILWAASALSRDERRAWLEPIAASTDLVDASIAMKVRSLP